MATPSRTATTRPRCSRFTWWQIPAPGGTTRTPSNACCAQRRSAYRSPLRRYSHSMFASYAPGDAEQVHLHRVVDDEVDVDERVHPRRIAAGPRHRRAHRREVDHRRDAREVLHQHAARHERDARRRPARARRRGRATSSSDTSRVPARRRRFSSRIRTVCGSRADVADPLLGEPAQTERGRRARVDRLQASCVPRAEVSAHPSSIVPEPPSCDLPSGAVQDGLDRWASRVSRRIFASAVCRRWASVSAISGGTGRGWPSRRARRTRGTRSTCGAARPDITSSTSTRTPTSIEVVPTSFTEARTVTRSPTCTGCRNDISSIGR